MRVNFVMSNRVESGIFNAIIGYFKKYFPSDIELYVTEYPLENMDIYHYHRPNLESNLLNPSFVTVHHDLEDNDPWFIASNYIDRYREADMIICLNKTQQDILKNKYDINNTIIIPHGINTDIFTPKIKSKSLDNDKLNIGIVSKRYGRRVKGEAYLYELYKRLDNKKIKFTFVGEGRLIDKSEAEKFGFEVELFEYLPYSLYNSLYHSLDLLLIPSLFEGGPANVPEALYTKTLIVGRPIAMIKDFVKDGCNGLFLTGNFDIDSKRINEIANNKDNIYGKMIEYIDKSNLVIPTWNDIVKKHTDSYYKIIKETESLYEGKEIL